jgi:hypothetical protein
MEAESMRCVECGSCGQLSRADRRDSAVTGCQDGMETIASHSWLTELIYRKA